MRTKAEGGTSRVPCTSLSRCQPLQQAIRASCLRVGLGCIGKGKQVTHTGVLCTGRLPEPLFIQGTPTLTAVVPWYECSSYAGDHADASQTAAAKEPEHHRVERIEPGVDRLTIPGGPLRALSFSGDIPFVCKRQSKPQHLIFVDAAGPCGSWLYRSLTKKT